MSGLSHEAASGGNRRALVIIDIQNDYFPGGAFPLWTAEGTLATILEAVALARSQSVPVILVQHIAEAGRMAPFFNAGSPGAEIHPALRAAAPAAPIVIKHQADSFHGTDLDGLLQEWGVREVLLCGMMTQNCVTHTALSRAADPYEFAVLADCCTTVSEILHLIALHALSPRVRVASAAEVLAAGS